MRRSRRNGRRAFSRLGEKTGADSRSRERLRAAIMRYHLGRLLQLVGMIVLPVSLSGEVAGHLTLGDSLKLSTLGIVIFIVGWLVQRGAKPG